jgi:uncharacterized repeat protein (TIGR03803 family)
MKTFIKKSYVLPVLVTLLDSVLTDHATAQSFKILHTFSGAYDADHTTNSDGAVPDSLILSGNTLYGTAYWGGSRGSGTIFKINTDGTGFTNLHSFSFEGANGDGAYPEGGELILSGNILYGTARFGGPSGRGTVFALHPDGTGFTTLYSFTNSGNGDDPWGGLVLSGNILYGTATGGGSSAWSGTVFALNTDGTGFKTLHSFEAVPYPPYPRTNSDGGSPRSLVLSNNTLYGTAYWGGSWEGGTLFRVNTDGTRFSVLHSFKGVDPTTFTNSDGGNPTSRLILSDNSLFGTAGGPACSAGCPDMGPGTLFSINTDGTGFVTLHAFAGLSDGAYPSGLVLSGNILYGTAQGAGSLGGGTVFAVNTDGTGFSTLYSFTPIDPTYGTNSDGIDPGHDLILSGNTLYGTALYGGTGGNGTVFSISLPPQLTLTNAGPNFILSWPTNFTGFTLQSTVNLDPSVGWRTYDLQTPRVPVNGQYTVTVPNTNTEQFFRLSQ